MEKKRRKMCMQKCIIKYIFLIYRLCIWHFFKNYKYIVCYTHIYYPPSRHSPIYITAKQIFSSLSFPVHHGIRKINSFAIRAHFPTNKSTVSTSMLSKRLITTGVFNSTFALGCGASTLIIFNTCNNTARSVC